MYSNQIHVFAVLVIVSVAGTTRIPAPLEEAAGTKEISSAMHVRSERGLFGRSRSRSRAAPSPYGYPPPPPPRRSRFRSAAGMVLPMAAGAAAGYLTSSLVLNQMKKHNPCALHGVGFTANNQMDSKIAADQRCQNMLNKYSGWFKNPAAGGATNPQQNGTGPSAMNTQQNGTMNTQQTPQTQQLTSGTGGTGGGTTRQQRAVSGPSSPPNYNSNLQGQNLASTGSGSGGSPCAGATTATCQDINGDSTCVVQTPNGGVPIKQCA